MSKREDSSNSTALVVKKAKMDGAPTEEPAKKKDVLMWNELKQTKECYVITHDAQTSLMKIKYDPNGATKALTTTTNVAAILAMQAASGAASGKKEWTVDGLQMILPAMVVRFENTYGLGFQQLDKKTNKLGKHEFTMLLESRGYDAKFLERRPNIEQECIDFYNFMEMIIDLMVDYMIMNQDAGSQGTARNDWQSEMIKNPKWTAEESLDYLKKKLKSSFGSPITHKVDNGKQYIEVKLKQSVFFKEKEAPVEKGAEKKEPVKRSIINMRGGHIYKEDFEKTGNSFSKEIIRMYEEEGMVYTPLNFSDSKYVTSQRVKRGDLLTLHGKKTNVGSIVQATETFKPYKYLDKHGFMGLFNSGLNLNLGIEQERQRSAPENKYDDYNPEDGDDDQVHPLPPIQNANQQEFDEFAPDREQINMMAALTGDQ